MSRYKKSEYASEKRNRPAERLEVLKKCQGGMGLCAVKHDLRICSKCRKPYCDEHLKDHPRYCLGIW